MKGKTAFPWAVVLIGLALQGLGAPSWVTAGPLSLSIVPDILHITGSFQGGQVTVSADIPKGASAVVEITGPVHENHLLRQGRRGGLWMSVGEVTVDGAPSAYLVLSTPDLPSYSDIGAQYGYGALRKHIEFKGMTSEKAAGALFEQFVKLKESEGLYGLFPKSLMPVRSSGDCTTVQGQLMLPSNISPGNYHVLLSVLTNGKLVEQRTVTLPVDLGGLPGMLVSLANQHAALYGLAAVVIAILSGFVMGFLFKGRGAH